MTMERRPSTLENKLLLLHAIDRLGAVTAQQLLHFLIENELMDYISIQLSLAELVDAGLLRKQPHPLGTLYALTGKGRDTLTLFPNRIPHSRIQTLDMRAERWRVRFRREKQMLSGFERESDGSYSVRLRLLEKDSELLNLQVNVPTHKIAERFCDAWIAQASSIYTHIMRSLGEGDTASDEPESK